MKTIDEIMERFRFVQDMAYLDSQGENEAEFKKTIDLAKEAMRYRSRFWIFKGITSSSVACWQFEPKDEPTWEQRILDQGYKI